MVFLAVEEKDRDLDPVGFLEAVALVEVIAEPYADAAFYPLHEDRGIDLVSSLEKVKDRALNPVIRTVRDYARDVLGEILLLCRKKSRNCAHAAAKDEYPRVIADLPFAEFDPRIKIHALAKAVRSVLAPAHAVRTLVDYENMTLDLRHDELGVSCDHRRMFVVAVKKDKDIPAVSVGRRSVVTCKLHTVIRRSPYVNELEPVGVKPIPALAYYV